MKLLFLSLYEKDQDEVIKNSSTKPNFAVANFNKKIIEGFYANLKENFSIINCRIIPAYPVYNKIYNKENKYKIENIKVVEISFINLPLIKYLFEYKNIYKKLDRWCNENIDDELYICAYGRRISHALAVNRIKRKYKNKVVSCMIYGDLSGKYATKTLSTNSVKEIVVDYFLGYSIKQSCKFDSSIMLTKYMEDILNTKKPFLVIEGLCDDQIDCNQIVNTISKEDTGKKIKVVYTGIISKKYGMEVLINAFKLLDKNKYVLELYGIGDMVDKIKKSEIENVCYKGYFNSDFIKKIQRDTDILINPRQNIEIYTKYSFPSKTLEYLCTGNPVICYKLDGIPDEYDDYLYYVKDNSYIKLAEKIEEVGNMSYQEKEIYKFKVLNFLKTQKTAKKQCGKIIDFLAKLR